MSETQNGATLVTIQMSASELHWLWKETKIQLEILSARVAEGRDIATALQFARYILWSKLITIFRQASTDGLLKVDADFIQWKANELQNACQQRYVLGSESDATIPMEDVTSLHEKIDALAGYVSRLCHDNPDGQMRCARQG